MEEEKKVIIKLKKVPLESERQEIKQKRKENFLVILLVFVIFVTGIGVGFGISKINSNNRFVAHSDNKYDAIKEYFNNVWLYKNDYDNLDELLDDKAIEGLSTFENDPYTTYMSKETMEEYASHINMDYVGIGVQYSLFDSVAIINRVFKDSPADKAGLKEGDIFTKIENTVLTEENVGDLKAMVQGEEGSVVRVTVNRNGEELEFAITRGQIYSTVYAEAKDDYVILEIMSFGETTAEECIKYLNEYKDYHKLIIDLRDNGGGYQTALQKTATLFVGKNKVVMNQTYNDGKTEKAMTIGNTYYDNFEQIVILVDGGTASAAEVLTLCIKENHPNCTIVGEQTYGKGVVQSNYLLKDGSVLKITTSAWTSPNGKVIEKEGITPDIEVRLPDIFYMPATGISKDDEYKYDDVSYTIEVAQMALASIDYDVERTDGYFDKQFLEALNNFKLNNGLKADGILDYETYLTIVSRVNYEYAFNVDRDTQLNKAKEILR